MSTNTNSATVKPAYAIVAKFLAFTRFVRYVYSAGNVHYYAFRTSGSLYPFEIAPDGTYTSRTPGVWAGGNIIRPLTLKQLLQHIQRIKDEPVGFTSSASIDFWPNEEAIPERLQRLFTKHGMYYDCGSRFLTNGARYSVSSEGLITLETWCDIRTQFRIYMGEYEAVPDEFPKVPGTGLHVSTQDKHYVAFYPDHRHILRDVPLKIKPGRYLKRYFPHMSDDEIRVAAAMIGGDNYLTYHSDFHDMLAAYRELHEAGIVASCMSSDEWSESDHPLMVYHNSDVELAVLRNPAGKALSRALYNKVTREFPMVYGNWEKMQVAMGAAGFKHGSLDGARINYIEHPYYRGCLVMPYIDGHRSLDRSVNLSTNIDVDYHNQLVTINHNGAINCSETSGRVELTERATCDCCGGRFDEDDLIPVDDYGDERVCDSCLGNHYYRVNSRRGDFYVHEGNVGNYIYIEYEGEYYADELDAQRAGYIWADYDGEWVSEDDAITLEDGRIASYNHIGNYVQEVENSDGDYVCYAWGEAPTGELWYSAEEGKVYDFFSEEAVILANARRRNMERPTCIARRLWDSLDIVDESQDELPLEQSVPCGTPIDYNHLAA